MTAQMIEDRLTKLKQWGWLFVMITLVLLNRLLDVVTPDYPYYHDGQLLYPLLAHYGIAQSVILVLLIMVLILGFLRTKMSGIWRVVMIGMSIPLCCGLLIADFSSGYDHIDSHKLGTHTYHLGFSYGSEPGYDYVLYVYTVWECDSFGLFCTRLDNPHRESSRTYEKPQHRAQFIYDELESTLYVRVDDDLYRVPIRSNPQ